METDLLVDTVDVRTPRGRHARMSVRRGTSDLSVVGSTMEGVAGSGLVDEYRLADLYVDGVFVDVGAHIGTVTVAVLLDNPGATAILVEPIPENVEMIRANLANNGLTERATVIEGAAGTTHIHYGFEGDQTAIDNRWIGNLSNQPQPSRSIDVRRVTLSDLLPADALKTDCEGGEWALLADPRIETIPTVFGEWHGGPGQSGIAATFAASHDVTFTYVSGGTGNFRAVTR